MPYPNCPSDLYAAVTKSDTLRLANPDSSPGASDKCKALYIGGVGDVAVKDRFGNSVTFVAVPTGTQLNIETDRVLSTGTSATNIVAIF